MNPHHHPVQVRFAKVLAIKPRKLADVLFLEDNWLGTDIPILCGISSTTTGGTFHPQPSPAQSEADLYTNKAEDVLAVVLCAPQGNVIVGFIDPSNSQVLFAEHDITVHRLPNDFYFLSHANGDTELYHPSGTYLRIAESPDHEDLTGKDYNGYWNIQRNTDKKVHLRLRVVANNEKQADITMSPTGNLDIYAKGNASLVTEGNLNASVKGAASLTVEGPLSATVTGKISLNSKEGIDIKAPSVRLDTETCAIVGNLNVGKIIQAPDIRTLAGVGLGTHTHSGVRSGGDVSAPGQG
jgi:hypothetical protein